MAFAKLPALIKFNGTGRLEKNHTIIAVFN